MKNHPGLRKSITHLMFEKDTVTAYQLLNTLKSKYSNDDAEGSIETAQLMSNSAVRLNETPNQNNAGNEVSDKFELLGNYPNPFNPSTTIRYTLPFQSSIELVIYDIMGREIKSFNISSQ